MATRELQTEVIATLLCNKSKAQQLLRGLGVKGIHLLLG